MLQRHHSFVTLGLVINLLQVNCEEGALNDQDIYSQDIAPGGSYSLTDAQLQGLHAKIDSNKDGKISYDEALAFARHTSENIARNRTPGILDLLDTSKDGKVSLEEHLKEIQDMVEVGDDEEKEELSHRKTVEMQKFKAADRNGDGGLELDELVSLLYPETHDDVLAPHVRDLLRQKDADHDGKLTSNEFWGPEGGDSEEERQDWAKLDLDGSGFLEENELSHWESGRFHIEEAMREMFQIADEDRDDHITIDELHLAKDEIASGNAQPHLLDWAEHHEL